MNRAILRLSLVIAALVAVVSYHGLFREGFYGKESLNWQAQSIGQDLVDLLLVTPVLLIAAFFSSRGSRRASLVWAGTLLYLIYTFTIYCFAIHFNRLFVAYCATLGLSFYALCYFIYDWIKRPRINLSNHRKLRLVIAAYFLVIAPVFYVLWLSEIIPANLDGRVPASLQEAGLFTNPVHVLDLSIVLPGIFIAGILLLTNKPIGLLLAPLLLTFMMLMDVTIGGLIVVMNAKGFPANWPVVVAMGAFAVFSVVLLFLFSARILPVMNAQENRLEPK